MSLIISWIVSAISLLIVAYLIPGFEIAGIKAALIAAVVIGLVNATVGLILKILTFPLSLMTLGLVYLVINALMLMLASKFVDGFTLSGFWAAFFGGIVLSIVSSVLGTVLKSFKDKKS